MAPRVAFGHRPSYSPLTVWSGSVEGTGVLRHAPRTLLPIPEGIAEHLLTCHEHIAERIIPVGFPVEGPTSPEVHPLLPRLFPANNVQRIEHQPDRRDVRDLLAWVVQEVRDESLTDSMARCSKE